MTTSSPLTRVFVIRHGETVWNAEGRLQGQLDSALSERGREQVRALARRIRDFGPVALYSSDLPRAMTTAHVVAEASGLTPIADSRLRERCLGVFEGKTRVELQAMHAAAWQSYKTEGPDFVIPGGESARQRHERTLSALCSYADTHAGQTIAVVGHGGTLNTAFRACAGLPLEGPRTFSLLNASLNLIEYRAGVWHLITWGDVEHLKICGVRYSQLPEAG
jgi:2,3-bisphosphoglycerate-dependent phosphoglycerate mutase